MYKSRPPSYGEKPGHDVFKEFHRLRKHFSDANHCKVALKMPLGIIQAILRALCGMEERMSKEI